MNIPSTGELGIMAIFQTCSELIYSLPMLFLTLELRRPMKFNKMHRRGTHRTNSTSRCTCHQYALVKAPPQLASLLSAKWRAQPSEVGSSALTTAVADRPQSGPHDPTFWYAGP